MAATLYQDKDFGGPSARILPGQRLTARGDPYAPGALVGYKGPLRGGNSYAEDLDNAVSSLRVDAGVVLTVSDSTSRSSTGSRTFVGPFEASNLGALGLDDRISAAEVHAIVTPATGATGGPSPAVELYSDYGARGRRALLDVGDYTEARLRSDEVDFRAGNEIRSLRVASGALAVLYAGAAFDPSLDSVAIPGPAYVDDLDRWGMLDRAISVRVFATTSIPTTVPTRDPRPIPHTHAPSRVGKHTHDLSPDAEAALRKVGEHSGLLTDLEQELAELRAELQRGERAIEDPKDSKWYKRPAVILLILLFIVVIVIAVMRAQTPTGRGFQGRGENPGAFANAGL